MPVKLGAFEDQLRQENTQDLKITAQTTAHGR